MARLILKSPYIKSTGGASGYLRYIATRERVELIPDDRPPTRKQEQLVAKLVKDFPDSKTLYEYEDYLTKPTKVSASAFITLALEANWDAIHESEQYMKYIATRPRAERIGAHGLFGDDDAVSLEKAMAELEQLHRKRVDAHHLPQAGGCGPARLRQRRGVAKSHPRPPQRHRGGDEDTARRLPMVRRLPRRGRASAHPHDGLVRQSRDRPISPRMASVRSSPS